MKDELIPPGFWKFDDDVTHVFDDMLRRSIPDHDQMRDLCFRIGARFVKPNSHVVDLGCARGEAISRFVDHFGAQCRYIAVDESEPMIAAARTRFATLDHSPIIKIEQLDLREKYPYANASLTLAVLTIQFTPIEYRLRIMRDIYEHTAPGGALIFVEKVLGASAEIDELLVDEYLSTKEENGYTEEQIERKKLSLEGVLVPVTAAWNEQLLSTSGWSSFDCFWRRLNFAGWVAVKDK